MEIELLEKTLYSFLLMWLVASILKFYESIFEIKNFSDTKGYKRVIKICFVNIVKPFRTLEKRNRKKVSMEEYIQNVSLKSLVVINIYLLLTNSYTGSIWNYNFFLIFGNVILAWAVIHQRRNVEIEPEVLNVFATTIILIINNFVCHSNIESLIWIKAIFLITSVVSICTLELKIKSIVPNKYLNSTIDIYLFAMILTTINKFIMVNALIPEKITFITSFILTALVVYLPKLLKYSVSKINPQIWYSQVKRLELLLISFSILTWVLLS